MDFFKLLGKGTKFNSKRYQEDIDIFKVIYKFRF